MKKICRLCCEREVISKGLCGNCYTRNWRKNNPEKTKAQAKKDYDKGNDKRKVYQDENKERFSKLKKEWYQRNKKERVDRQRNYRTNNKESIKISNKRYATDNPEKIKQNHDNQYFDGMRIKALKRDKFACQVCGMTEEEHLKKWNYSLTVHHKDGNGWGKKEKNNALDNLQTLCKICHGKAHGRKKMTSSFAKEKSK